MLRKNTGNGHETAAVAVATGYRKPVVRDTGHFVKTTVMFSAEGAPDSQELSSLGTWLMDHIRNIYDGNDLGIKLKVRTAETRVVEIDYTAHRPEAD